MDSREDAVAPMTLMMITNDVGIAAHAVASGVDRIFVDLETLGKEERQGHLDTHRAKHTPDDVRVLREALPGASLLARVNPLYAGSAGEIDAVIAAGADHVMLPMFTTADEVATFIDLVDGRAGTTLLLETPQALTRIDDILAHHAGIDEIHIGLNDLHLGMGLAFMFELLSGGVVEYLADKIRARGIRFGFGGIACVGEGAVPAELVIGEHVRLGSEMVILSRSFHQQARTVEELEDRLGPFGEVEKVRACEAAFRAGNVEHRLNENRRLFSGRGSRRGTESGTGRHASAAQVHCRDVLVLQKPGIVAEQRALIEASLSELEGRGRGACQLTREAAAHADATVPHHAHVLLAARCAGRLPHVEWVHFLSAGVDRIWPMDVPWSRYQLSKSVGVHASTISEYVLGAILYALKGFGTFHRQQQQREWRRFWLDESEGKTLGIVGVGTIGTRLAQHATALGMRVIGTVTSPRAIPHVDVVYGMGDLDRVLSASDFVVLLVPLTDQTRGLLGASAFRTMKERAWLINVARGEVVVESALIEALRAKRIAGAVLDVFEEEPLATSSPLWELDNVLITPHVAGTTQHYMPRALSIFKDNYREFVRGNALLTYVSIERGY